MKDATRVDQQTSESVNQKESSQQVSKSTDQLNSKHHHKPSILDKEISTKAFILSHLFLLIISVLALFGLYYYLHGGSSDEWKKRALLTQAPKSLTLDINSPDEDSLLFDKSILVSGSTSPGAVLIITINGTDLAFESNKKGDFSKILTLLPGVNNISITALDSKGGSKTVDKVVYFSEEKI